MSESKHITGSTFGAALRTWRQSRKCSQLELSLAAGVSQRHVSWLETGRSRPSREMVVTLAGALNVPLRERNTLLASAGFASVYQQTDLATPQMATVAAALEHMLDHHAPYPALVADRHWNLQRLNAPMEKLLSLVGDIDALFERVGDDGKRNLARATLHPEGLRPMIDNWSQAAPMMLHRLRLEAMGSGSPGDLARLAELESLANLPNQLDQALTEPLLPTLPLVLRVGPARLSLFSVISTFGTPLDVTADELRIESFFPADADTEAALRKLA